MLDRGVVGRRPKNVHPQSHHSTHHLGHLPARSTPLRPCHHLPPRSLLHPLRRQLPHPCLLSRLADATDSTALVEVGGLRWLSCVVELPPSFIALLLGQLSRALSQQAVYRNHALKLATNTDDAYGTMAPSPNSIAANRLLVDFSAGASASLFLLPACFSFLDAYCFSSLIDGL